MRNLRYLSVSRLHQPQIVPDDFLEFGVDLEELKITSAGLHTIKNHAFQYVHGLKRLDLSDNNIATIENDAFDDVCFVSLYFCFLKNLILDWPFFSSTSFISRVIFFHAKLSYGTFQGINEFRRIRFEQQQNSPVSRHFFSFLEET